MSPSAIEPVRASQTRAGKVAAAREDAPVGDRPLKAEVKAVNFFYGTKQALKNINLPIPERTVTAHKTAASVDPLTGLLNRRGFSEATSR